MLQELKLEALVFETPVALAVPLDLVELVEDFPAADPEGIDHVTSAFPRAFLRRRAVEVLLVREPFQAIAKVPGVAVSEEHQLQLAGVDQTVAVDQA
jgi:hypothetical protein